MLTWLYVPGDRPDMYSKAVESGADVVIVDLEDAVVPAGKDAARWAVCEWLPYAAPGTVEVRVNAPGTPWVADDLEALGDAPSLVGVRLPKVESADDVRAAADLTGVGISCLLETALGVERAFEIATAHPRVVAIGLGEADLASDLGTDALDWPRSRVVVAARAAGLPPPAMSVYPNVDDLDGLASSCRRGRALGFRGRAAIHPRQVPVIREAFRPDVDEVADAHALLAAFANAVDAGRGVTVLSDGRMVDAAMIGRARRILDDAQR
ncbi:MAG TPA: CoA ester lyase [Jatrophihabitantaceae bacterium]|jgi:citrate lyase subunit beta/citryl-CoA lyase